MNQTEQTILEQFPYWRDALELDLEQASLAPDVAVVVIGCGTSYYLAQTIAANMNANGLEAMAVPGGEWNLRREQFVPNGKRVQLLALSRSGETTETVAAASSSLKRGERVIGITCEANSSLTRACTVCVYAPTHPLEDIVMTTSASLMLLVGLALGGSRITAAQVDLAQALLERSRSKFDSLVAGRTHFVYLGGGALYGIANEGALKLMEMSLSFSQAYHPLEYRHGPISLVDERSLAVILYQTDPLEESKLARELQSKGAKVIGVGGPGNLALDLTLDLASSGDDLGLRGLIALPALQWLGERVAQSKGLDTRAPRHLTKVVVLT
jgi:glutamine---fructose-6-phosphate transaminase (isomerizing)